MHISIEQVDNGWVVEHVPDKMRPARRFVFHTLGEVIQWLTAEAQRTN